MPSVLSAVLLRAAGADELVLSELNAAVPRDMSLEVAVLTTRWMSHFPRKV